MRRRIRFLTQHLRTDGGGGGDALDARTAAAVEVEVEEEEEGVMHFTGAQVRIKKGVRLARACPKERDTLSGSAAQIGSLWNKFYTSNPYD